MLNAPATIIPNDLSPIVERRNKVLQDICSVQAKNWARHLN